MQRSTHGPGSSVLPCMQGGAGADSYAANSMAQNYGFHAYAKPYLEEALQRFILMHSTEKEEEQDGEGEGEGEEEEARAANGVMRSCRRRAAIRRVTVADFGCSHGQNAVVYANFIVDALTKGLLSRRRPYHAADNNADRRPDDIGDHRDDNSNDAGHVAAHDDDDDPHDQSLEIQYFFSDLPSNDFNQLFQSDLATAPCSRLCYAAGVPGSFYNRLFPSRSLNFVISTFSLHWLSQVPPEVLDKSSSSWNGDHVWIWSEDHSQNPQVSQAFARQSMADLVRFLKCRAEEMTSNAILFILSLTRTQELPHGDYRKRHNYMWCGYFESTWNEMVNEGLISCEERDTFNVPHYSFHRKELEAALKEVSEFKVLKLEILENRETLPKEFKESLLKDPQAFGKARANFMKSVAKPMVQAHIGLQRTEIFFERLQKIASEKPHLAIHFTYDLLIAICQRS